MAMLSRYLSEVSYSIRRREETDKVFNFALWAILMIITFSIASIYVIYALIKRRDEHFSRQHGLQDALIGYFTEMSKTSGRDLSHAIGTMAQANQDCKMHEEEKGPVLWTILSLITGIASLYVMYFLTEDAGKHDKRQKSFVEGLNSGFQQLGFSISPPRVILPERPFVVFFIVGIALWIGAIIGSIFLFPLGLLFFAVPLVWMIYWLYVIFSDFNNHFRAQWAWEDETLRVMSQISPEAPGIPPIPPGRPAPTYEEAPRYAPPPPPQAPSAKKFCVQCGAEIPSSAIHCPRCGASQ